LDLGALAVVGEGVVGLVVAATAPGTVVPAGGSVDVDVGFAVRLAAAAFGKVTMTTAVAMTIVTRMRDSPDIWTPRMA
jgi:hypothetical protein